MRMELRFDPSDFWNSFANESKLLYEQVFHGKLFLAYDRICKLLESANCPYVCEVTCNDQEAILIFTPESDPEVAKEIDEFVYSAPVIPNWGLYTRRQRKPVDDVLEILKEIYGLDASDATFSAVKKGSSIDVVMHTKAASEMTTTEASGFVEMFLEHALGEQTSMSIVGNRSIDSLTANGTLSPGDFVAFALADH